MIYQFTRAWATVLIVLGVAVLVLGVAAAGAVLVLDLPLPALAAGTNVLLARAVAAVVLLAAGCLLGCPLIVAGEVLRAFLDQRRYLRRISARLRRWERQYLERPERPAAARPSRFKP